MTRDSKQRPEERPVAGDVGPRALPPQEGIGIDADEMGGQSGVGEVVLGSLGKPTQVVPVRYPAGDRVEQPQLGEDISIRGGSCLRGLGVLPGRDCVEE